MVHDVVAFALLFVFVVICDVGLYAFFSQAYGMSIPRNNDIMTNLLLFLLVRLRT